MARVFAVTVKVPEPDGTARFFEVYVTSQWAARHDNGALISCGLTVGQDGFTAAAWERAKAVFLSREMSEQQYRHSGCQSGCVLRGNAKCRW